MSQVSISAAEPAMGGLSAACRKAALWIFIATLAWAPFPLGGAIPWAAGLQEILIAVCWVFWAVSAIGSAPTAERRLVTVPLVLAAIALAWAAIQICPFVPAEWAHPVWGLAADALGRPVSGVISLNPWHTQAEIAKLASYAMACWLAFSMARRQETAALLLKAVVVIGAGYVLYAFGLVATGSDHLRLFYALPYHSHLVSGPFMLHNSFATWCGLSTLAAVALLFAKGSSAIVSGRGIRRLTVSLVQFSFGRGALYLVAAILCFAGVVASASRAGFAATMCGLAAMALAGLLIRRRDSTMLWTGAGAVVALLPLLVVVLMSGGELADRVGFLFASDTPDNVRPALWAASIRMIGDAPWLGLGLGTFQDAYPLYASRVLPFVMDKAHCDYLEFVAGIGVPAAAAWLAAITWLAVRCLAGVRSRRRDRHYCLTGLAATVLIAVHSTVDFSLQLPAVSLLYATLLGIGAMQSLPSNKRAG